MSSLQRKIHQTGLPPRPTMTGVRTGPGNLRKKKDYSAIHWSKHFNEKRYVKLENGNSFCVYEGGMKKSGDEVNDKSNIPVLILLHGGMLKILLQSRNIGSFFRLTQSEMCLRNRI